MHVTQAAVAADDRRICDGQLHEGPINCRAALGLHVEVADDVANGRPSDGVALPVEAGGRDGPAERGFAPHDSAVHGGRVPIRIAIVPDARQGRHRGGKEAAVPRRSPGVPPTMGRDLLRREDRQDSALGRVRDLRFHCQFHRWPMIWPNCRCQ